MGDDPSPRPRHTSARTTTRPRVRLSRPARVAAWVIGGVVFVVVLFVFVFPTRTYLDQRQQLRLAGERLKVLDDQNKQLASEAARLQTPQEIERLARQQYHMVQPGEKAYVILPAPVPTTTAPPPAPPAHHPDHLYQLLTSWLP